jgi:hypothetical protein
MSVTDHPSRPRSTSEEYFVNKERRKTPNDLSGVSTDCASSDAVLSAAVKQW